MKNFFFQQVFSGDVGLCGQHELGQEKPIDKRIYMEQLFIFLRGSFSIYFLPVILLLPRAFLAVSI